MVYHKTMDKLTGLLKDIEDILGGPVDLPEEEGLDSGPVEVLRGDTWIPVSKEDFASWTGPRRIWGIEYHGPVTYKNCKNGSQYTGPRSCPCNTCQSTVESKFKMN